MNQTVLPWWRMQPSEKTDMPTDNKDTGSVLRLGGWGEFKISHRILASSVSLKCYLICVRGPYQSRAEGLLLV